MASPEDARYVAALPAMLEWIDRTLASFNSMRRSVQSFNFQRLPHYFSETILTTTGVVTVDRVPTPPLSALGLIEFKSFEEQDLLGITFKDTYFANRPCLFRIPPFSRTRTCQAVENAWPGTVSPVVR